MPQGIWYKGAITNKCASDETGQQVNKSISPTAQQSFSPQVSTNWLVLQHIQNVNLLYISDCKKIQTAKYLFLKKHKSACIYSTFKM